MAVVKPKLRYVILYVADVDRTLSFYARAFGLELKMRQGPYAEVATGAVTLGFVAREFVSEHLGFEVAPGGGASEIAFVVPKPSVQAQYDAAVAAGAAPIVEPRAQPWGQVVSYVRDPDGHLIEICSPTD